METKQKLKDDKDKEVHKNTRIKIGLYKENSNRLTSNFSISTVAARRKWDNLFKMLREHVIIKSCGHHTQFCETSFKYLNNKDIFE